MTRAAAEADRMIANLVQVGTIISIENAAATARVKIGDLDSQPIPVMQLRSGNLKMHWMPSPGEQVTVLAPSGDMARAFVMGSLPMAGGAIAPDAGSPTMDLGGGTLRFIGDLFVQGTITCSADVIAAGVSLVNHTHGGVQSGGSSTQEPN